MLVIMNIFIVMFPLISSWSVFTDRLFGLITVVDCQLLSIKFIIRTKATVVEADTECSHRPFQLLYIW